MHTTKNFYPCLFTVLLLSPAFSQAKVGDLVEIEGVRDNQIRGIGLVVGLNGTGDGSALARQLASNLLKRLGTNIPPSGLTPDNMAVVMVTATLPPFARPGARIDVTVSSMGDADSLRGGTLIATQLVGFDNRTVYAIAEGPIATGAVQARGGSGSREVINHPTVGRVPRGALVEKDVPQKDLGASGTLRLMLRNNSYGTSNNLVNVINKAFPGSARAVDGATVDVRIPQAARHDPVGFLAQLAEQRVDIASRARVVINERNGTIIVGGDVVLLPVAIAHSNLSISIKEELQVSQPAPLSQGTTTVTPKSDVSIQERGTELRHLPGAANAADLAKALNALGVSPLDLITIFQMLEKQGALQAELIIE